MANPLFISFYSGSSARWMANARCSACCRPRTRTWPTPATRWTSSCRPSSKTFASSKNDRPIKGFSLVSVNEINTRTFRAVSPTVLLTFLLSQTHLSMNWSLEKSDGVFHATLKSVEQLGQIHVWRNVMKFNDRKLTICTFLNYLKNLVLLLNLMMTRCFFLSWWSAIG